MTEPGGSPVATDPGRPLSQLSGEVAVRSGPRRVTALVGIIFSRYAVLVTLIMLAVIFTFTNSKTFPTGINIQNILGDNAILLILTLGALVPLVVGEFDLSLGFMTGLSAVTVAILAGKHGMPLAPALGISLLVGLGVGIINGVLVGYAGINSFIVTLATGTIASGVSLLLSNGEVLFQNIPTALTQFGQGFYGPVPAITALAIILTVVTWFVLSKTLLGRRLYATGLGREPARLTGVKTRALVCSSFVISGLSASIAGVLVVGRVGSASPQLGPDFLLPSLAAAFLGATVHTPGRFNVIGSVIAILFVGIGLNGLQLNGAPFWVQPVFQGGVLVLAVGLSRLASSRTRNA
ncbi:MAG: ABC transporter permease [Mycobacteriales bacterium]